MVDWFCNTCLWIYLYSFCLYFRKETKGGLLLVVYCKLATFVSMWRHQLMLGTGGWRYTSNNWLFVVACFQGRQLLKCLSLARTNQPCKKKQSPRWNISIWWRWQAPKRTGHHCSPTDEAELTTLKYASFLSRSESLMDLRTTEQS